MRDSALLFDASSGIGSLRTALQAILEPYFTLKIVLQPTISPAVNTISRSSVADVRRFDPAVIFLVLPAGVNGEPKLLESIRTELAEIPIIAVIEACEPKGVFDLLGMGAADFITSPLRSADVLPRTWRLMKRAQREAQQAKTATVQSDFALKQLVGGSPEFVLEVKKIPHIAKCEVNVLIAGETGTGKEVYARAIHYCSSRSGKPFLPVNCGAIPLELVENELFGHERGAFTNASSLQPGLIEEASGGTLFLDEIDCLPLLAQVKLLRFLQEKEYRPLGSARMRRANVRIIAASNLDLQEAVGKGTVRQDLFYRLNTISLILPPLRERREDVPLLARHFLAKYSREFEKQVNSISSEALHRLTVYNWPGNVRELEHVIERAIVLCDGTILQAQDIALPSSSHGGRQESLQEAKAKEIARFEKDYIQGLLCACSGNITRAAQVAQKNRRAFWQLIQKHQIDITRFKSKVS